MTPTAKTGLACFVAALLSVLVRDNAYDRDGFTVVDVLNPSQVESLASLIGDIEKSYDDGRFPSAQTQNVHLTHEDFWKWLQFIVPHAASVLRVDPRRLRIMTSTIFVKYPGGGANGAVGWHQDLEFWDVTPERAFATWLAVDEVDDETGCVTFARESHKIGAMNHTYDFQADNLLMSKKAIQDVQGDTVCLHLKPGQMSVHDGWTPHKSNPNRSRDRRRLGVVVNWILDDVNLAPSREGYGAIIPEFRKPVNPNDPSFPPVVLQNPPPHPKFLATY